MTPPAPPADPLARLAALPDDARTWAYATATPIPAGVQAALLDGLDAFLTAWRSHGRHVDGAVTLVDGRVLVVAATVPGGDISGCGIDAHVREVERLGAALGIAWASALDVVYRHGEVRVATRPAFRVLAGRGDISTTTPVYDLSAGTVGALRRNGLALPLADTWAARLLPPPCRA